MRDSAPTDRSGAASSSERDASLGDSAGSSPGLELTASTCASLPIFPELTDAQVEHVIATVNFV